MGNTVLHTLQDSDLLELFEDEGVSIDVLSENGEFVKDIATGITAVFPI